MRHATWGWLLLPALGLAASSFAGKPFDAPLKTRHVELEADPQNPNVRRRVSCFYYRSVVVKQVDYGEVGAQRLALLPVLSGNATPCRENQESYEYVIPSDSWSGYSGGAKAEYAFFDAPDGSNGGLGFMVLRVSDRKQLFEDTARNGMRAIEIINGGIKLRYERVYPGNCSAITGGSACRESLSRDTGVSTASLSLCAAGYAAAKQAMAKARCAVQASRSTDCIRGELARLEAQNWNETPTVLVYEVEVVLGNEAPAIRRRGDTLACYPAD